MPEWFITWAQSPGFGGAAAVVAAGLALAGAVWASRVQRNNAKADRNLKEKTDRKDQWWQRAKWALDYTLSDDPEKRVVGFKVLEALGNSEWANEHEADVIAAATERTLAYGVPPRPARQRPWGRRELKKGGIADG